MTTRVTVHATAGHAVRVMLIDAGGGVSLQVVEPGEVRDFHVYEGRSLAIAEGDPADRPRPVPAAGSCPVVVPAVWPAVSGPGL